MQLGMSDAVGQRLLGGQDDGQGPFMGRDMMGGGGAPPLSQTMKRTVDKEVNRIVFEQYERGMRLLKGNRYLLDLLAERLMEVEKVNGEELMKMINEVAMQGKLATDEVQLPQLAMAAYTGELASTT